MPWSLRLGRGRGPPAGLLGKPDQSLCLSPAVGCRLTPLWVPAPPELASLALGGVRQTPSEPSQKQPLRTFGALQVPPDEALAVLRVPAWRLGPRPPSQVRCVSRALDQSCPLPSWSWPQRPCEAGSPESGALGDGLRLPGPAPRSCGLSRLLRGPWGAGCLPKFPGNPLGPQSSSQLRAHRAWPPPRPTVVDMLSARPVQAPGRPHRVPSLLRCLPLRLFCQVPRPVWNTCSLEAGMSAPVSHTPFCHLAGPAAPREARLGATGGLTQPHAPGRCGPGPPPPGRGSRLQRLRD